MSKTYRDKDRYKLKNKDMLDYDDEYWELWCKFNKPDKIFKYLRRRIRKAKEKQAIKDKDYENIPKFRKDDEWEWW